MASPLREKRTWPPREKDAESAESAAFEATVAVVKETVVRSGEVLVSAKEDLSDHQRWLEAQRAAVQADRARHERWLQRQQEKQEALAKRERARRRRQLAREHATRAVENAAFALVDFILSLFWLCVAKVAAFFAYLRSAIVRSVTWVGARLRDLGAYVARFANAAASAIAIKTRALAGSSGRALSAASSSLAAKSGALARSTGSVFAAAGSSLATKSGALARSTGNALSAATSSVATESAGIAQGAGGLLEAAQSMAPDGEVAGDELAAAMVEHTSLARPDVFGGASDGTLAEQPASATVVDTALAQPTGEAIAARLAPVLAPVAAVVRSGWEALARLIAPISAKAAPVLQSTAKHMEVAFSAISAKIRALSPRLHGAIARRSEMGARPIGEVLAKPSASLGENEVSSPTDAISSPTPARIGGFDLSQMLIISGVVLLVCGGLLVGSGLMLRPGTGPVAEKAPSPHSVAWFFEEPELPIVERSVFTAELTPHGVLLTGLAIKAENNSDEALSGLEGVVKPDAKKVDLKLEVKVDMVPADGAHGAEAAEVQGSGVIPPHAFFTLVFPFPPEAQGEQAGVALNDFIAAYGGLMLKLRYDVAGTQKSLIHYLSPEMLKSQLTEIQHEADGS